MSNKIQPPMHGPFPRRADVVAKALGALLESAFGAQTKIQPIRRGSDQNLVTRWELPSYVQVVIKKSVGGADPSVWIHRNDPTGSTAVGTDWKNDECGRDTKDKCYHLDAIMEKVKTAVDYNRSRGEQLESNTKAMLSDLDGVAIPEGVAVTRNPGNGRYTIRHTVALDELTVKDAKTTLSRLGQVLGVMKPSGAPPAKPPATPMPSGGVPTPKPVAPPAPKPAAAAAPKPNPEGAPKTP